MLILSLLLLKLQNTLLLFLKLTQSMTSTMLMTSMKEVAQELVWKK